VARSCEHSTVMNLRVPQNMGDFFLLTQEIFSCQEKLCSMEFVMRHAGRIYAMQTTDFFV
jgi:hypothetical protein